MTAAAILFTLGGAILGFATWRGDRTGSLSYPELIERSESPILFRTGVLVAYSISAALFGVGLWFVLEVVGIVSS